MNLFLGERLLLKSARPGNCTCITKLIDALGSPLILRGLALSDTLICLVLNTWQIKCLSECLVSIQPPIIGWIHVNCEATKHLVDLCFQLVLVDVILGGFEILKKRCYPFLIRKLINSEVYPCVFLLVLLTKFLSYNASLLVEYPFFSLSFVLLSFSAYSSSGSLLKILPKSESSEAADSVLSF